MRTRPHPFFSFWPLAAVVVLAVNDHVLKARFHNALCGKLSDLAGCFVLPLFLSAVLELVAGRSIDRRTRAFMGLVLTTVFFTALKTSPPVANGVASLLGHAFTGTSRIIADPSDLLALPLAFVATWFELTESSPRTVGRAVRLRTGRERHRHHSQNVAGGL